MRLWIACALLAASVGCATMSNPASAPAAGSAQVQPALDAVKTYQFGDSREALLVVEKQVQDSLASPAMREGLANALAAMLSSDATFEAKQFACRQLALIGTAEQVPAIAPLLNDPKTADMARYALEPIPGPEADHALLAALSEAPAGAKAGIVNSLGARHCAAAADKLETLTQDSDPVVAAAAKSALAQCRP